MRGGLVQVGVRRDGEVQKAVIIGVKQHGASVNFARFGLQSCLFRNILKCAIARIAVDFHAIQARDKQAHLAAVVKVGKGRGDAGARACHPRLLRHVGEGPIAIIVKQMIPGGRNHHVQIRMAIIVVIPYGDRRAEEGDKVLPAEIQRVVRGFDRLMRIEASGAP